MSRELHKIPGKEILQKLQSMLTKSDVLHIENMFQNIVKSSNDPSENVSVQKKTISKKFDRTNRLDGRKQWTREIHRMRGIQQVQGETALNETSKIVDIAKGLLFSGIPEQVLDLYSAYYEIIFKHTLSGSGDDSDRDANEKHSDNPLDTLPVIPDRKLILTTIRAFIALADVKGALKLLQAVSRAGLDFDAVSKSLLMVELADCSSEGLQAALQIRTSMVARQERISASAYGSILKGIRLYGLVPPPSNVKLLVNPSKLDEELKYEGGPVFHFTPVAAREHATNVMKEYTAACRESGTSKRSPRVVGEFVRLMFQSAVMEAKVFLDKNFETDTLKTINEQAKDGIGKVLEVMEEFEIGWDIHTADVVMDECLRVGDLTGVSFVSETMWNKKIWARTSTFNTLLQRYADNGDGESAYKLVSEVMDKSPLTKPDADSWELLLTACSKTARGRCYSAQVITSLRETGAMRKYSWDRLLELCILSRKPYDGVLLEMIEAGEQPDEHSIMMMLSAFRSVGDLSGALALYKRQKSSIVRDYSLSTLEEDLTLNAVLENVGKTTGEELGLLLPPPTRRTVSMLLEALRDKGKGAMALEVLREMISRTEALCGEKKGESRGKQCDLPTPMSKLPSMSGVDVICAQISPDVTVFNLAVEACVQEGDAQLALAAFAEMERFGLSGDRRTYAALVKMFGLKGDVPSALGVFQEMRRSGVLADVAVLQSVLDVCLKRKDPSEFAQVCSMLTTMVAEGADLEVYSKDLLMQCFPDARSLGAALTDMESQPVEAPPGTAQSTCAGCSVAVGLDVISVLAQACRTQDGPAALTETLAFLGKMGVRPDKETMEYFRLPAEPKANSPNSRHYIRQLVPHKARVRSLLDMELPVGLDNESGLPERGFVHRDLAPGGRRDVEPYFQPGEDHWVAHAEALKAAMLDPDSDDAEPGADGDPDDGKVEMESYVRAEDRRLTWTEISGIDVEVPMQHDVERLVGAADAVKIPESSQLQRPPRTHRSIAMAHEELRQSPSGVQAFGSAGVCDRPKKRRSDKLKASSKSQKQTVKISASKGVQR